MPGREEHPRGVYVSTDEAEHLYALRCEAGLAAVRAGAALAGPTAALHWELPVMQHPAEIFLRGLPNGRYARGVRPIHGSAECVRHAGLLVTTPAWTVIDCARLLSRRDGVIVADAVLHEGLCTVSDLRTTLVLRVVWEKLFEPDSLGKRLRAKDARLAHPPRRIPF